MQPRAHEKRISCFGFKNKCGQSHKQGSGGMKEGKGRECKKEKGVESSSLVELFFSVFFLGVYSFNF